MMGDGRGGRARGGVLELLVFEVGGEAVGVQTRLVREVRASSAAPAAGWSGPVIDLRARLGFPPAAAKQRLVVVHTSAGVVGLVADGICEVLRLSDEMVEPAPAGGWHAGSVTLEDRVVLILGPEALAGEQGRRAA